MVQMDYKWYMSHCKAMEFGYYFKRVLQAQWFTVVRVLIQQQCHINVLSEFKPYSCWWRPGGYSVTKSRCSGSPQFLTHSVFKVGVISVINPAQGRVAGLYLYGCWR